MKTIALAVMLVASAGAAAQGAPASSAGEIEGLFVALEKSGCEFERNSSWYDADEASRHLRRKYAYLLKKDMIASAEAFIDLAATKSSMSGTPYRVRCGGAAPLSSKTWFDGKLHALRAGKSAGD